MCVRVRTCVHSCVCAGMVASVCPCVLCVECASCACVRLLCAVRAFLNSHDCYDTFVFWTVSRRLFSKLNVACMAHAVIPVCLSLYTSSIHSLIIITHRGIHPTCVLASHPATHPPFSHTPSHPVAIRASCHPFSSSIC